ncbi:unnamed protein product [Fraxinus pennsylvanica]|uniref:UBC core domain-containing protein n=1 Tax=Fraxinus pennsylvanica TaxID=56036 RepID=A0AAD1YRI8_9LAMI|nr:unnamed protein product [Fraxinus pennsylvanica]
MMYVIYPANNISFNQICLLFQPPHRMSTPSRKRLMRDFKRLQQDPPAGISGAPQDNNIMLWNAVIFGPDDTPWDGGTFKLTLQFTEDYPNKPPTVRFVSRMFHPNIYADGNFTNIVHLIFFDLLLETARSENISFFEAAYPVPQISNNEVFQR